MAGALLAALGGVSWIWCLPGVGSVGEELRVDSLTGSDILRL